MKLTSVVQGQQPALVFVFLLWLSPKRSSVLIHHIKKIRASAVTASSWFEH